MKSSTPVVRTLLCLLLFCLAGRMNAQTATAPFTHQGITASTGDFLGFLQYKPAEYDQHPNTKYPIIIFLHGIGERGNGTTDLDKVAYVGMPRIVYKGNNMKFTWNGKTETFLVLAPQCPLKYNMWPAAFVNDLISYAKQNLHIDTNRIFLTGLSMGGGGSLRYISDALPGNAKNVAAVATIAAPCTFRTGEYAAQAHLPVWSFHAEDDPTASVQCTKNAIAGLNAWNPSPKPLLDLWPKGGHIVWDRVYTDTNYQYQGIVNIYEWFLGQNKSLPVNQLPVANAGDDKSISGNTIVLDGGGSTDADGKLVRYVWKKISGPASGVIVAPMGANPSTTVMGITATGKYTYELAAVDDRAAFTRDTVCITVTSLASAAPVPVPPVKDTIPSPVKDSVATPVKDSVKTSPVSDSVSNPVKDTLKTTPSKDTLPTPAKPVKGSANMAPVANAGKDVNTNTGWPKSMINATLSKDTDGWITKVRWSKISGPSKYTIVDSTILQTYATNLDTGMYVFRVIITDNKGATGYDDVKITVAAPAPKIIIPNMRPLASAGEDGVATLGWNKHILNSSLSKDKDGWITSIRWSKISGPSAMHLIDSTALVTYATDLVEGTYTFRVKITDNKGASSVDDVKITVISRISTTVNSALMINGDPAASSTGNAKDGIVSVSPNPASNTFQLQYSSQVNGATSISIFDMNGRVVRSVATTKTQTLLQQSLNIHDLTNGIYYAVAKTGSISYPPVKFIKQ